MRIGYFTSIEGWGGSETYLKSLMLGVRERGHEPVLFGIDGTRLWEEAKAAGITAVAWSAVSGAHKESPCDAPAPVPAVPSVGSGRRVRRFTRSLVPRSLRLLAGTLRDCNHLARVFGSHQVDLMHVSVSGCEIAGLACRRIGIPAVAMNMITPPEEPYWARLALARYTMRRYDHVSSQSEYCTRSWAELVGLDRRRCSFVWNSPDIERFHPGVNRQMRKRGNRFRIVSLGRLHPMKGYEYLVDALALLSDNRATVVVFGEGHLRRQLEGRIASMGLRHSIQLPGYAEDPEIALRKADCFVLPSVSHESCPAVLAEAMASGLPLITSDFGPLAEVNIHGETGLVVPVRNAERLAQALRTLMNDPALAARMGQAGRERAVKSFSRDLMVEKTLALYAGVVSNTRKGDVP